MTPVKVNIYISYAPEDKAFADKLQRWLRPMQDEVNLWFDSSTNIREPEPMPLPWQILLFWYNPSRDNLRSQYSQVRATQLDRAHIYLFLTSSNSLGNDAIDKEIETAAHRRIRIGGELSPRIYPVILAPCRWKTSSRLAMYNVLGLESSIKSAEVEEDAYMAISNQLAKTVREVQRLLDEAKYRESRPVPDDSRNNKWLPYLGTDDSATVFRPQKVSYPSEWLGWAVVFALLLSLFRSLQTAREPERGLVKLDHAEPAFVRPREYIRERPLMPPPENIPFRPIDERAQK